MQLPLASRLLHADSGPEDGFDLISAQPPLLPAGLRAALLEAVAGCRVRTKGDLARFVRCLLAFAALAPPGVRKQSRGMRREAGERGVRAAELISRQERQLRVCRAAAVRCWSPLQRSAFTPLFTTVKCLHSSPLTTLQDVRIPEELFRAVDEALAWLQRPNPPWLADPAEGPGERSGRQQRRVGGRRQLGRQAAGEAAHFVHCLTLCPCASPSTAHAFACPPPPCRSSGAHSAALLGPVRANEPRPCRVCGSPGAGGPGRSAAAAGKHPGVELHSVGSGFQVPGSIRNGNYAALPQCHRPPPHSSLAPAPAGSATWHEPTVA